MRLNRYVVKRRWWAPTVTAAAAAGGFAFLSIESLIRRGVIPDYLSLFGGVLLAHVVGAVLVAGVLCAIVDSRQEPKMTDRSDIWTGVACAVAVNAAIWIVAALMVPDVWPVKLSAVGAFLLGSIFTFELPFMCIVGAVCWITLTHRGDRRRDEDDSRVG